jgi:hypothetical protein
MKEFPYHAVTAYKGLRLLVLLLTLFGAYAAVERALPDWGDAFLRWLYGGLDREFFDNLGGHLRGVLPKPLRGVLGTGAFVAAVLTAAELLGLIRRNSALLGLAALESAFFAAVGGFMLSSKFSAYVVGLVFFHLLLAGYLLTVRQKGSGKVSSEPKPKKPKKGE